MVINGTKASTSGDRPGRCVLYPDRSADVDGNAVISPFMGLVELGTRARALATGEDSHLLEGAPLGGGGAVYSSKAGWHTT
jgi:hypothetical protein